MNRTLSAFWVSLALGCMTVAVTAADKVSTFSKLPATDTLQVRFASSGCFHSTIHEFTFRHGATGVVAVVSVQPDWLTAQNKSVDKSRTELGRVTLSDSDFQGLDALVRFYRSKPRGGCTTTDTITIAQIRGGKTIATEEFIDGSCSTFQTKGVTTLPEIIGRLQKRQ